MNYKKDYIPTRTKRRSGEKLKKVQFIVAHDTGNPNSTAQGNVTYYKNSCNTISASAHIFVDDVCAIECVPLTEKAWHVLYDKPQDNKRFGVDSNDAAIGVELCYFPKDKARSLKAYNNYVKVLADLCKTYKLDPLTKIAGHDELDPGRKTDPNNALRFINKNTKDLLNDVKKAMNPAPAKKLEVNKEYKKIKIKFANSSKKQSAFLEYLKEIGMKYDEIKKGGSTTTVTISFAAKSSKYGLVIEYLNQNKISFE